MREVPDVAEPWPEVAAARPAQVADADARRTRMGGREVVEHLEHDPNETVVAPPPPCTVRLPSLHRVPREEVHALGREAHAADEAAPLRSSQRLRAPPLDLCAPLRRVRTAGEGGHEQERGDAYGAQHHPCGATRGNVSTSEPAEN